MPRPRCPILALSLLAFAGAAPALAAQDPADKLPPGYGQNLISAATGQHRTVPTGNCIVWANAEGLGVGPAQLGGLHGLTMNIDLKPIGKDVPQPVTFAAGLADLKARFPTAPDWLVKTLEKNQAAIEAACVQDHDDPVVIHKITAADRHG
jgi:hypothetical protein